MVAPTIQALIASRLDGLGRLERQILTGGAIIGERLTAAAAAAVAGIDPVDGSALVTMLVTKAFVAVDNGRPSSQRGGYAFLQGAVRRVTLSRLSRRERKRFHLAAADYLRTRTRSPSEPPLWPSTSSPRHGRIPAETMSATSRAGRGPR